MRPNNHQKKSVLSKDEFLHLFKPENTTELSQFTRSIESNPSASKAFERLYDSLASEEELMSDEEFFKRAVTSREELKDHLQDMSSQRLKGLYLTFTYHGRVVTGGASITIEIGWHDSRDGLVCWDRWTQTVEDPVIAFACVGFLVDHLDYRNEPPEKVQANPPLYRFHPERFKAFHACAEIIGKVYRHQVNPVHGFMTFDQLQMVMNLVMDELNEKRMRYPLKLRKQARGASHLIDSLEGLVTAYGRFVQAGRQILDFPPQLVELLAQTDVSDIPMNTIKMPFAAQYLHFGPQPDMELESGWLVDGAYIESHGVDGDWRITITACPKDPADARLWFMSPEPTYTQDFVERYRLMDMATAVTMVLSDRLADLSERVFPHGGDITADVREEADRRRLPMPENTQLIDVSSERGQERIAQVHERHPIYMKALQLAVNALCYVTSYPDDIEEVWPEGAPIEMKRKAASTNAKEARRATSKLASLGYVPVHICGRKLAEQMPANALPEQHDGHVATHWRRGHWRNQPYGQGHSLRKLIWMMPVLVGAHRAGEEPKTGHLYRVS